MSNDFKKYFPNPSRTKQCFKDECDINNILKKYKNVMGVEYLSQFNTFAGGQFGDFSGIQDYRSALDKVNQAKSFFDSLPAFIIILCIAPFLRAIMIKKNHSAPYRDWETDRKSVV